MVRLELNSFFGRVMPLTDETFAVLVARARDGDSSAIEEIVRTYEPEVRIVARVRLGPALRPYVDSIDLVQSVHRTLMLGLQQNKFDISTPQKLLALALTVVRRKVARQWRQHRHQQRPISSTESTDGVAHLLTSLCDPQPDPSRNAELQDQIARVCRELNDVENRVIELRFCGYNTAQVARMLGLDADVLRVQLSRLRRKLERKGIAAQML